jgi:hypothetical protein
MDSHRPDPEVILDRLKAEQKTRLTMFLGAWQDLRDAAVGT